MTFINSDNTHEGTPNIPSYSTIYCLFKKQGLNKLSMKGHTEKRKIIKEKAGELGHIDLHYLPKEILSHTPRAKVLCDWTLR